MLHTLARADLLPTHLAEVALRGADPKWLADPEHREERARDTREYIDVLVASFPRESCQPGSDGWEPVAMTRDDIPNMDQRDVDVLEDVVLRIRTVEQVNGEDGPADPAEFRGERIRVEVGEDIPTVGDAPEPDDAGAG